MPALPIGDIGPCEIVWNYGESAALYLGKYLGQVKLGMETNAQDVLEEQNGDAAVNAVFTGSIMSLEIPLTRSTLAQLQVALNTDAPVTSGDHQYLKLKNQVGCDLYALAKAIVIKPICDGVVSIDPAEWIHLYKCHPIPGMDLSFDKATQRIFPTKFKVFVSQESGFEGDFGTLGMESGSTEYGY
jgi:hypothetical protein